MPMYRFQQMATVWYEVIVEADNRDEAEELGLDSIARGNGEEADGSFELQGETWLEEMG